MGPEAIKGPGPATATFGVLIEPTANKAILEDIEIEDFGHGVQVDGPNFSTLEVITAFNNKGTFVNGANAYLLVESRNSITWLGFKLILRRPTL